MIVDELMQLVGQESMGAKSLDSAQASQVQSVPVGQLPPVTSATVSSVDSGEVFEKENVLKPNPHQG